jgi:hypothetical protein
MSTVGDRKHRIVVRGRERAARVASIARAIGVEVVDEGPYDWAIVETDDPGALEQVDAPALVIAPRRLWHAQVVSLTGAGARRVLDAEATVLDVLLALTELCFVTTAEQRRWWRKIGGLVLTVRDVERDRLVEGRLAGITRTALFAQLSSRVDEGARVELSIDTPGGRAAIGGRVAYAAEDAVAIELDLGDPNASAKIERLDVPKRPSRAPLRRTV